MQVLQEEKGSEMENRNTVRYYTDSSSSKRAVEKHLSFLCNELLCVKMEEKTNLNNDKHITISGERYGMKSRRFNKNGQLFKFDPQPGPFCTSGRKNKSYSQ